MSPAEQDKASTPSLFGIRRTVVLEIAAFYAVAVLIDGVFLGGGRFAGFEPHPFWLFSLVVAAAYGTGAGVLATVLGVALTLLDGLPVRDPLTDQSAFLLEVLGKPLVWLTSAVLLGELRTRQSRAADAIERRLRDLEQANEQLGANNMRLESTNERLRTSAAGQVQTAASLVRAARAVDMRKPEAVLTTVRPLIESLLSPTAYSIYYNKNENLELAAHVNDGSAPYARQRYAKESALHRAIVLGKRVVHVASAEGQAFLANEGVLAGPIVDVDSGAVLGMLKIDAMPMTMLRHDALTAFRAVCEWIGGALRNAERYELAASGQTRSLLPGLMTDRDYNAAQAFVVAMAERGRFEVAEINVKIGLDEAGVVGGPRIRELVAEVIGAHVRADVLAFDRDAATPEFALVAPMATAAESDAMSERLRVALQQTFHSAGIRVHIYVGHQMLYIPPVRDFQTGLRAVVRRIGSR